MADLLSQALAAVSSRSAYAAPLAFGAGAVSSLGPCTAPRLLSAAALMSGDGTRKAPLLLCVFVAGVASMYCMLSTAASLATQSVQFSMPIYLSLAIALGASGCAALWGQHHACAAGAIPQGKNRAGSAFLLGASSALVVSPCCGPLVMGIAAFGAAWNGAAYACALVACFALGHALPVIIFGYGMERLARRLQHRGFEQPAQIVSATLTLGLAAYYAVLA